jgi:hypothetical protein
MFDIVQDAPDRNHPADAYGAGFFFVDGGDVGRAVQPIGPAWVM